MKNAIEIVQMAFRYDNVKEPQFREISCFIIYQHATSTDMLTNSPLQIQNTKYI